MAELSACVAPKDLEQLIRAAASGRAFDEVAMHLTNTRLSVISKSIELMSGKRVPNLMKQRKDYVLSWWRQALAKDAHVQMLHSPLPVSPAKRVEANPLLAGSGGGGGAVADARRSKEERVALRELLAIYGEPDRMADGGMELRVPNEHLQIVCSQVATLTGGNIPRQPRAKREWLAEAAMTARAA